MEFVDKHTAFNSPTHYDVTNEEPELWNKLLGNKKFARVGAIASSGDVVLLSLLQRTTERLVAIDHSYKSLASAYAKALMLQRYGADELYKLLTENKQQDYLTIANAVGNSLPEPIKGYRSNFSNYTFVGLRREWGLTPKSAAKRSKNNLDKLLFVHGDLADLAEYGPLDLLYTSNAHEHSGRDRKVAGIGMIPKFLDLLHPDGLLLTAVCNGALLKDCDHYQIVATQYGYRTTWWYYVLRPVRAAKLEQAG